MSTNEQRQITIKPVVSYPRRAQVGRSYLMTIDLELTSGSAQWKYDEEEYPVWFILNAMPFFSYEQVGEHSSSVVLHRFGGTYGPATFLLTAAQNAMEGKIDITMVNHRGVSISHISLPCEIRTGDVSQSGPLPVITRTRRRREKSTRTVPGISPPVQALHLMLLGAEEDRQLINDLVFCLTPLQMQGLITIDIIEPQSNEAAEEVYKQLNSAQIILLCLSPDAMVSDAWYELAMRAMERSSRGKARAIPTFLRPVDIGATPFTRIQCLPIDGRAVTTWPDLNEAFTHIAQEIAKVVDIDLSSVWDPIFKELQQTHSAAFVMLQLCAFLAPACIPEELLAVAWQVTAADHSDPARHQVALTELLRRGLLQSDSEGSSFSIEPFLQYLLKHSIDPFIQPDWARTVVLAVSRLFPEDVEFTSWQRCQQLLPHAQVCAQHIQEWNLNFVEAVSLLDRTGYFLLETGNQAQYTYIEALFRQALTILEKVSSPKHTLDVPNHLGMLYQTQGRYEQAEPLYKQALMFAQTMKSQQNLRPTEATNNTPLAESIILNNLATLYLAQGRDEEAQSLLEQALEVFRQLKSLRTLWEATILNNLAALYSSRGLYAEAVRYCEQALETQQGVVEPNMPFIDPTPATMLTLNNLAGLLHMMARYQEAVLYYEQALQIGQQTLGTSHEYVVSIRDNYTALQRAMEERKRAS